MATIRPASSKFIENLMEQGVSDRVFPGGVLLAARGGEKIIFKTAGITSLFTGKPVRPDTVFDLASLTKPLATTLAVMYLAGKLMIDLDTPVSGTLPSLENSGKAAITWRQLLAHTSGLPGYRPYYRELFALPAPLRKTKLHRLLEAEPLVHPVGEKTVYSDVGFLLMQWALEVLTGRGLDQFLNEKVYEPLGIRDLFFLPDSTLLGAERTYAATERCPARGIVEGVVHDENAWAIGGVGGHAGLFGTADGVFRLLNLLLDEYAGVSAWFGHDIVAHFFTRPGNAERVLGFDVPSPEGSSCGSYFDRRKTVGHLGFTGTSFWMDTARRIIIILLTNRVHPIRSNQRIKQFRPVIHDAVMSFIKSLS